METDNHIELYERTPGDVSSMIKFAKLNEKNLTNITQALYYPASDSNFEEFKLIELNSHLLEQINDGKTLYLKGGLNEKLVLCTDEKTYDVKEAEISNSLLIVPHLKTAQETSKSPLKSPKGDTKNRSLDSSLEDDTIDNGQLRQLERRDILKISHEYFECREINPRFRKLGELLSITRYSGPENEYCIDRNLLFTFDQLLDTIQCSRTEFVGGLRQYHAIQLDGRLRVLEYQYEYRVISLMLDLINENSWKLDEVEKDETINALKDIVPSDIVKGLFELYTIHSETGENRYQYREDLICQIIAQNLLQQGRIFHIDDFMTTWQDALPDGMKIAEKYLQGIGIVDRDSSVHAVRALIETNLPTNILDRLKVLFKTKDKWTLEQIEPYIQYFTTPQLTITSILAKHARTLTENGQRKYVSKH